MGIALQHFPVLMTCDERNLFDLEIRFEEAACAFMAQVMKVEVFNPEFHASPAERSPDGTGIVGEDAALVRGAPALRQQDLPGVIACEIDERHALVIAILVPRSFRSRTVTVRRRSSTSGHTIEQISDWRMAVATAKVTIRAIGDF